MTLPEFLQPESPFRPWAMALGACLFACLPRGSRRLGGILFFVVAGVAAIYFGVNYIYASYVPAHW